MEGNTNLVDKKIGWQDISDSIDSTKVSSIYYCKKNGKLVAFSFMSNEITLSAGGQTGISGVFSKNKPVSTTAVTVAKASSGDHVLDAMLGSDGGMTVRSSGYPISNKSFVISGVFLTT